MIVHKALKMAEIMKIPVLGIVENMAYFECPDCGKKHYIFGSDTSGVKIDAEIPILPGLSGLCDSGKIEDSDAVKYLDGFVKVLEKEKI